MDTRNVACRIFKEQIDLIKELPEQDRAGVLYNAVMNAYNQFENQNENQFENQNEYAYISSSLSISIINLLSKNIVFKEYNNYGGKRENSGRPKKQNNRQLDGQVDSQDDYKGKRFKKPTMEEIKSYCMERNNGVDAERFFDFYESKGWKVGNQPMKDWKAAVRTWEKKEDKPQEEVFEPTPEQNAERELMLEAIRKTEELQKKRIEAKYGKFD